MIQWTKDGNVNIIDDDSMEANSDIYMYTSNMTLSNINASYAGIYNCTAVIDSNNKYIIPSNVVTSSIGLSVTSKQCCFPSTYNHYSIIVPNPDVSISPVNKTSTIAGGNIQLSCTVMSDNVPGDTIAVIEWMSLRNETVINSSRVAIRGDGQFQSTLLYAINGVKLSDSGDYYCTASINSTIDTPYLLSSDTVYDNTIVNIMSKLPY